MRDSFIFFKSFYDAINCLGEKAQLKLYKSIMKLNFNCCKNVTELEQLCNEIETELKQNRNVFAQFLLIKPHILKSLELSFNGRLGGAPRGNKNAKKNKLKEIEKEEEIEIEYIEKEKKEKESQGGNFWGEYSNVCLSQSQYQKLLGICASEKLLNELINSFSVNIEVGKERPYAAELPNAHYERLKSYYNFRKKHPDRFIEVKDRLDDDPVLKKYMMEGLKNKQDRSIDSG